MSDKELIDTPDNKLLQNLFGPTISIKELIITAAALIVIYGFVTGG